ncbi:IS200/IS605 family transposase [Candidatus Poribacteria bacterium]|nr:IS200/IS605 family transposase [Candidatus Poribacteria bacterium]MYI93112.1 IS200/IS605 family transposase [Candidatus Poribacteria bacterium]
MADTYTQLYIHIVFAVKGRQHLIPKQHKEALHQYITRIITNKKQTLIRINSMPDHIHILIGMKPDIALSDLVRDIKANSSKFINKKGWVAGKFEWQTGFGAFSYSRSQLDVVVNYINNQEAHHSHLTFREEYLAFLKRFDVPYNPKYVFDPDDNSET